MSNNKFHQIIKQLRVLSFILILILVPYFAHQYLIYYSDRVIFVLEYLVIIFVFLILINPFKHFLLKKIDDNGLKIRQELTFTSYIKYLIKDIYKFGKYIILQGSITLKVFNLLFKGIFNLSK